MIITTTTVKSLLLLVVLFAWMAQMPKVSPRQPLQVHPNTDEATNEKTMANFGEEIEEYNKVAYIKRVGRQDKVYIDHSRYNKRTIAVAMSAYWNKVYRHKKAKTFLIISNEEPLEDEYNKDIERMDSLLSRFNISAPSLDYKVVYYLAIGCSIGSKAMLRNYYEYIQNEEIEDAMESLIKGDPDEVTQKNLLANYLVPFAKQIFWAYDRAVDYITREYQKHCISPDGIVRRNKLYYRILWWSGVRHAGGYYIKANMNNWICFMATACPIPPVEQPKFLNKMKRPLTWLHFEQEVRVPEPVAILWQHLPVIGATSTGKLNTIKNSYLIGRLWASFEPVYHDQYLVKDEQHKHDDNLWIGYQKKLIVLLTIIRVMREDEIKATNYLNDRKKEFRVWRDKWPPSPIAPQIVAVVTRALYRSKDFKVYSNPIVQMALTFLYEGADVQFEPIEEKPSGKTFKDIEVTIPEEIKIFCTQHLATGKRYYSELMNSLVVRFKKLAEGTELTPYEKISDLSRNETWSEFMLTIVPELVELLPDETINAGDYDGGKSENSEVFLEDTKESTVIPEDLLKKKQNEELPTNSTCCGSALKWVNENRCCAAVYATGIIAGVGTLAYYLFFANSKSPTSEPFRNITLPTENPVDGTSTDALLLKLVWWIVAVMAIGAIVCCLFCLVRRKRSSTKEVSITESRKNNRKDEANKNKKEPKGGQVRKTANGSTSGAPKSTPIDTTPTSTRTTKGTPTSTINTSYITPSKYDPTTLSIWNAWFGTKPTKPPKSAINKLNDGRQASQIKSGQGANSRISSHDTRVVSSSPTASSSSTNSPSNASSTVGASSAARTSKVSPSKVSQKSSVPPSTAISVTSPSKKVKPPAKKSPFQVPKSPSPSNSPRGKAQSPTGKNTTKPGDPKKGAQKKQSKK